jgi:hypothetical protein
MERDRPRTEPYLLRVLLFSLCCEGDYTKNLLGFLVTLESMQKSLPSEQAFLLLVENDAESVRVAQSDRLRLRIY